MTAKWYRYEDRRYSRGVDDFGDPLPGAETRVNLYSFDVLRTTPKGVWITDQAGNPRFILRNARRRFACPTIEEAAASFIARKKAQIRIYQARIASAEQAIDDLPRPRTALHLPVTFTSGAIVASA